MHSHFIRVFTNQAGLLKMADYPSSVLKSLTEKLGHSLLEVREGALKTLKLKFDHGLLQAADAVQRKDLLEKLLDWFNKPHCSMESEVLSVLLMLSEVHSKIVFRFRIKFKINYLKLITINKI